MNEFASDSPCDEQPARSGEVRAAAMSELREPRESQRARRVATTLLGGMAAISAVAAAGCGTALYGVTAGWNIPPGAVDDLGIAVLAQVTIGAIAWLWRRSVSRRAVVTTPVAGAVVASMIVLGVVSLDRIAAVLLPRPLESASLLLQHPRRGWTLRPSSRGSHLGVSTRLNRFGMRGDDISTHRRGDERRVLFLGDSVTFGYCLDEAETLPEQACRRLMSMRPGLQVTALNAGIGGYGLWQELDYFCTDLAALEVDTVVVVVCINDMLEFIGIPDDKDFLGSFQFENVNDSHWSGLIRAWRTWQTRRMAAAARSANGYFTVKPLDPGLVHGHEELYRKPASDDVERAWNRLLRDLSAIHKECARRGATMLVLPSPFVGQLALERSGVDVYVRISDWAGRNDVGVIRVIEKMQSAVDGGASTRALFFDDVHPTQRGTAILADEVAAVLAETADRSTLSSDQKR